MSARKNALRSLLLAAAATAVFAPYAADSGPCGDAAARNLLAAGWLDQALNPHKGEDMEFLYSEGGFPNIMVLMDTSTSMQMLPPDGPGKIRIPGSTLPDLPMGVLVTPTSSASQTAAFNAPVTSRVVGCGLDAVSKGTPAWYDTQTIQGILGRRFYPPCGKATDMTLVAGAYQGHTTDYGASMTVCPYLDEGNVNMEVPSPGGYDPDFYAPGSPMAATVSGGPNFFGKDLVFHDSAIKGTTYATSTYAFKHNFGDGWVDDTVYPFKKAVNSYGTIADFCATQGTAILQDGRTRADICNECLTKQGWYYDGVLLDASYAGRHPSIWYTGNYLNFFPPKFITARKVMKDIIASQSRIRLGLASFDGNAGATIEKDFNPTCQMGDSNFDSNRSTYGNAIDAMSFTGSTPLALALDDVGRHYHSQTLPWFGAAASKSSPGAEAQYPICYSCQVSTVILLTDGVATAGDGSSLATTIATNPTTRAQAEDGWYAGDSRTGYRNVSKADCPECWTFSGAEDYKNNLIRVAWYLNNFDLRQNTETTKDCMGNGGPQVASTYAVGFSTATLPSANTVLEATAKVGGGSFVAAENPQELKDGIAYILQEISTRATSFSVATISTLQTTSGRAVIVPRFDPSKKALWRGHLFRFDLFSEFVNDCEPGGAGDLDCDGTCAGTFLQDNSGSDGDISLISEDGNGTFVRNEPIDRPTCPQAPACVASGGTCAVPGSALAVPFWDAEQELANKAWTERRVYTAVDENGDGRIDQADPTFRLTADTAWKIAPYLALGSGGPGMAVCSKLAADLSAAGDPVSGAAVLADKTECAKTIVRFLLGADVLNEMGKTAPEWPPASQDALWDRSFKLGDIFHSSPVVVEPPFPRLGILCEAGYTTQCLKGIWATPTKNGPEAYDEWSLHEDMAYRDRIILVGANDGLLHAFHGGEWIENPTPGVHYDPADDAYTSKVDESLPPFNGSYTRGTAEELWAFLPPDQISKIPALMGNVHQFFVDGTPMVRDIWVDGATNDLDGVTPAKVDDVKQGSEFHTVAITGARRGGTRHFALDVTRATQAGEAPTFLWIYPQPNDPESLTFGETYSEYLPSAPPIVPVRVEAGSVTHPDTLVMTPPKATSAVKYREKWIAMLNGGFDLQYVRGRGVHFVDAWTGRELFDFSYPLDPAKVAADDPRLNLRFPVTAAVGGMAWGPEWSQPNPAEDAHQYFFDTATFGDAGGQVWVLRFFDPAKLDLDGRATNWLGARAFQMGVQGAACKLCAGQPIFYLTNNYRLPGKRTYRVAFGTGDRYNLLDKNGGTCGPDNIRACVLRGCTVTMELGSNFIQAPGVGFAQRGMSQAACNAMSNTQADGSFATCTVDGKAKISVTACPGALSTTKEVSATCAEMADGYQCSSTTVSAGDKVELDVAKYPINLGNWFLSLIVFEESGRRGIFWTPDEAKAYDAARIWVNQTGETTFTKTASLHAMAATDNSTVPNGVTDVSTGWAIYYDHGPIETIDIHDFNLAWQDERTSSGGGVGAGLITWNTTAPTLGEVTTRSGNCFVSKCTTTNRRIGYHYAADPVSGLPVFTDLSGNYVRSTASYLLVPSQADQRTVFVNQSGQVSIGLTSVNPEKGATNVGMSDPVDPTGDLGFVEVDEELHECRHADGVTTKPVCK